LPNNGPCWGTLVGSTLLVASYNLTKVEEIRRLLQDLPVEVVSLQDLAHPPKLSEPHSTFIQNAAEKATIAARATGRLALADDSGLVVPALDGSPGVHSSRVADTDPERIQWLLSRMAGLQGDQRQAYFVCVAALAAPDGEALGTWQGRVDGVITHEPQGAGGFGYDPVFFYPPDNQTFAQMSPERKNQVSHRGQALRAFAQDLPDILTKFTMSLGSGLEAAQ